jgi:hypothetical protein
MHFVLGDEVHQLLLQYMSRRGPEFFETCGFLCTMPTPSPSAYRHGHALAVS